MHILRMFPLNNKKDFDITLPRGKCNHIIQRDMGIRNDLGYHTMVSYLLEQIKTYLKQHQFVLNIQAF